MIWTPFIFREETLLIDDGTTERHLKSNQLFSSISLQLFLRKLKQSSQLLKSTPYTPTVSQSPLGKRKLLSYESLQRKLTLFQTKPWHRGTHCYTSVKTVFNS